MTYTADNLKAAIGVVLDKRRADVVSSWANEQDREKRERHWIEFQLLDSIGEMIKHEFSSIIDSAAGGGHHGSGDSDGG